MKKNGFTLAEVLITLAIIGVVATMTLPALMTNTQEQQARTGLKKGINTLTEAAQMNQSLEGWDFASAPEANTGAVVADHDTSAQSFESLIVSRMAVDYSKGSTLPQNGNVANTLAGYSAIYLRDGSAIYYHPEEAVADPDNAAGLDDGLALGYIVYYDTNGVTGPNIVSNCNNAPLGELTTDTAGIWVTPEDATTNCSKADRVIRDVFAVRIRGTVAQPEGDASTWLVNGDVRGGAAGGN